MSAGTSVSAEEKNGMIFLQIAQKLRDEVIHCNRLEEERSLTQAALQKCMLQLVQSSDVNMQQLFLSEANQILGQLSTGNGGFSVDAFLIIKKMALENQQSSSS